MKTALFTTDTTHHLYFLSKLVQKYAVGLTLIDDHKMTFPFPVLHEFEKERDAYEKAVLKNGEVKSFEMYSDVIHVVNMKSRIGLNRVLEYNPDIVFVFGTGKISTDYIKHIQCPILNFHGGDPGFYRGLDTHLWSIYHHDFEQLKTTLHFVDEELDAGDIVYCRSLPCKSGLTLTHLRLLNTDLCVEMALDVLNAFTHGKPIPRKSQELVGRYYSAMPACLKDVCVPRFQKYCEAL